MSIKGVAGGFKGSREEGVNHFEDMRDDIFFESPFFIFTEVAKHKINIVHSIAQFGPDSDSDPRKISANVSIETFNPIIASITSLFPNTNCAKRQR